MIKSKLLSDSAWKDVLAKNKGLKDNGLSKALAEIRKLGDDDHADALKVLDEVLKLVAQLKKSKEVAAAPAVGKHLTELTGAAESALRDVGKAKAEADKQAKAEAEKKADAETKKREQDAQRASRGEDAEDDDPSGLLTTKLVPLLRQVNKGETLHALVASTGKQVVVMLSRKPIAPARRKLLADELGAAGGIRYFVGHCLREQGVTTFALKTQVAGLAKKIKLALLEQTGLRVKLRCRGEDGETDDDGDAEDGAASADSAPIVASTAGADAGPSPVALGQARAGWRAARAHALAELGRLKKILQDDYRDSAGEQTALANALLRVDATIRTMDESLGDTLDAVINAPPDQRAAHMAAAKGALHRLIELASADEILQHIDGNELAPDMLIAAPLRATLKDIARSLS